MRSEHRKPVALWVTAFAAAWLAAAEAGGGSPAVEKGGGAVVFDFENGLGAWVGAEPTPQAVLVPVKTRGRTGHAAELRLEGADCAVLRLPKAMDLSRYERLRFDVRLPNATAHMHVAACFVDMDELWFQTWKMIMPRPGKWTTVDIDLRPEAAAFKSLGHARPWGPYVAQGVQGMGLRLFSDRPLYGAVQFDNIALIPGPDGPASQQIFNFETTGNRVGQYEKFEITFELSRVYGNPFDPEEVEVWGVFAAPGGKVVRVPGFFHQHYERQIAEKVERLIPAGSPKWKIRFAPRELGEYSCRIEVFDGERMQTAPRRFTTVESANPGFIRVCEKDRRYFEFENGEFFYPIGHNIPATFNVKGASVLGLTMEPQEGTFAYDRFLDGMARGHENFARIWLGSWSFALEWSRRYDRSYRDLGRYNLENAWRLDYVLDKAERLDIYVQLALTTFGHFRREEFEGDWPYSPYNVKNGGPLNLPQQFWTHEPSQKLFQRMVRYAVARWGYATHVASWELSNEIDLVTAYKANLPHIIRWHERSMDTIRKYDPNPHMITTNFAHWTREPVLLQLPRISYSSTNHYNVQIVRMMRKSIYPKKASHGKPAIMAECGYDFKGAQAETTERYLHICLWSSYMIPFGGAGMSWWWDFLDDRDLYHRFRPLAEFAKGEDRRGRGLETADGRLVGAAGRPIPALAAMALKNDRSGYVWIYERRMLRAEADPIFIPQPREASVLELPGFRSGTYRVEFWETRLGRPIHELTAEVKDGTLQCPVPTFTSDIAAKIRRVSVPKALQNLTEDR